MAWSAALRGLAAAGLVAGSVWLETLQRTGAPLHVLVSPSSPLAGQTVRVESDDAAPGSYCLYGGHRYPFYPLEDGRMRALVPVPFWTPEGSHALIAFDKRPPSFLGPALGRLIKSTLAVRLRELPLRRIKLPKEKFKLFSDPGVPDARERMLKALQTASPAQGWRGRFSMPVRGITTSLFGSPRVLPNGRHYVHKGLDIAAPFGHSVGSPNRGVVILAGALPLQGHVVVIDHGQGVLSAVQHLSKLKVKEGQTVEKGTIVGAVGSEGISTGAHVHWSLFVHGEPVDPEEWTLRDF